MNPNDRDHAGQRQDKKRHGERGRSEADDRSRPLDRQPDDSARAIPELDEPDVEGVGEEGRHDPGGDPGDGPARDTKAGG